MRNNNVALLSAADSSASLNSGKIDANQLISASFMAIFTDAASAGTLQIQYSNDPCGAGNVVNTFTPANWANVPGTTATATVASGATSTVYLPQNFVARWLRVTWTRSGGAGTMTVNMNAIGF